MKKAFSLEEIDAAVNKFMPVTPSHPFYVNFDNLRGDFQEREVMRMLHVHTVEEGYQFNEAYDRANKTLLFLAGMRGSGKTSELAKYAQILHAPDCYFVITCNIDEELDMDNVQYMDIVIYQLEKLLTKVKEAGLKLDDSILESMTEWFKVRVKEINRSLKAKGGLAIETGIGEEDQAFSVKGLLGKLLGITLKLKGELSGSYDRAESVRETFRRRFSDFSQKFNAFIEQTNDQLRREKKGKEVLFIIDGLEKTMSAETRRKIIMEESNRIRQIKVNTLFTLPIELMKEEPRIRNFAEIITFPTVKICERDGTEVDAAMKKFEEFVDQRIDYLLFDSIKTIRLAIQYSGGSPRQLLSIIEKANWQADSGIGKITCENMERAIEKEGNALARYIEPQEFEILKEIKSDLESGAPIGFDVAIQTLLEKNILFEYNDGTYKRVNPLLERSKLYQHKVLNAS